jgi:hypothetical protein
MSHDLIARAQRSAAGAEVPVEWGELIEIAVGGHFLGRHRGHGDGGRSGAWLAWDVAGNKRFIWGNYRLDQEYAREGPAIGDTVAIVRGPNYKTRFDDDGEASGLGFGLAIEPSSAPLPADESGVGLLY